ILVLQGDGGKAEDNEVLGELVLGPLRQARRGEVEIEVRFDISGDGIISISAQDTKTGQEQSLQIRSFGGLTSEELQEIVAREEAQQATGAKEAKARPRREQVRALLEKGEQLFPRVRDQILQSTFGTAAVAKAEACLRAAREYEDAEAECPEA